MSKAQDYSRNNGGLLNMVSAQTYSALPSSAKMRGRSKQKNRHSYGNLLEESEYRSQIVLKSDYSVYQLGQISLYKKLSELSWKHTMNKSLVICHTASDPIEDAIRHYKR